MSPDPWIALVPPGPAAHTPNEAGRWQPMVEHTRGVAALAEQFAASFGAGELARWAGLLHDLGKYSEEFQRYLKDCHRAKIDGRPPPPAGIAPHKQAGAMLGGQRVANLLAPLILGHHGGMPKKADVQDALRRLDPGQINGLHRSAAADVPELDPLPSLSGQIRARCSSPHEMEMLARMVFSCLTDADALDTEAHFEPETARARRCDTPSLERLRNDLSRSQSTLQANASPTELNSLRREVYEACVAGASSSPGAYRLTVPTGGGKTRSSLAFALEHACRHDMQRVIYAIPYTSIVDQTAKVFEEIFGPDVVLEHHSAIEPDESGPGADHWRRLACQNWDAPLIVTTTVQLFESLFGNRPGRSRKVHRLARSVIVLDEVQTLPVKLLSPLVDGLRCLCDQFGATLLLCTATQPALHNESLEKIGFPHLTELAPRPAELFATLQRVDYDLSPLGETGGWSWERVAEEMRSARSCLAVVNTRKDALVLLDALSDPEALHLSTLLCGRHRRAALAEITRRLGEGEPCRVVSTQVVECGCDLDFPLVLRASGPLDRIVQAAGRCNREGRLTERGRVVVFRPAEGGAPRGSYAVAMGVATRFLNQGVDLHDPAAYERYFRQVYRQDSPDAYGVQALRKDLDFPAVAEKMRLIDQATLGVIVRYRESSEEIEALLQEVRFRPRMTAELWRRLQPFMVSLPKYEFDRFQQQGLIAPVVPDVWIWMGKYDDMRGLAAGNIEAAELIL